MSPYILLAGRYAYSVKKRLASPQILLILAKSWALIRKSAWSMTGSSKENKLCFWHTSVTKNLWSPFFEPVLLLRDIFQLHHWCCNHPALRVNKHFFKKCRLLWHSRMWALFGIRIGLLGTHYYRKSKQAVRWWIGYMAELWDGGPR